MKKTTPHVRELFERTVVHQLDFIAQGVVYNVFVVVSLYERELDVVLLFVTKIK